MTREVWENCIKKCHERFDTAQGQMEKASITEKGDFQNQMDGILIDIKYYKGQLSDSKSAKEPGKFKIFLYVIVSKKSKVRKNIGKNLFGQLDSNRYHDSLPLNWIPFNKCSTIQNILAEFKNSLNYNFEEKLLDGDVDGNIFAELDENIENSILIVDLLSLDDVNNLHAVRFDSKKVGILMPICKSFKENFDPIFAKKKSIFQANNFYTREISCPLYLVEITKEDEFKRNLNYIFQSKFPIKNQSTTFNAVRDAI